MDHKKFYCYKSLIEAMCFDIDSLNLRSLKYLEKSKKRLESLSKLWLIGFGIAIVALILSIFLRTIGKIPILSFVIIYVVYKIIKKRKDDHTEEK